MINHISINLIPIVISTVVCFSLGAFWFSPALFGVKWKLLLQKNEKEHITVSSYSLILLVILMFNIAMSYGIDLTQTSGMTDGVLFGFFIWLGLCGTTIAIQFLFERRSLLLFFITSGYTLVVCIISATMNALWI